jgi:ABC-type transport system involved in Fe-S cluster assembly, ATPase component
VPIGPDERAKLGLALAFQYPMAIPGVSVVNFLSALRAVRGQDVPVKEFRLELKTKTKELGVKDEFLSRYVNDGFSGGEKKRLEILQMLLLNPTLAVLDETDSGLDIDALKTVASGVNALLSRTALFCLLHTIKEFWIMLPHFVHILQDGRIIASGGSELAKELEAKGYDIVTKDMLPAEMAAGAA